MPSVQGVYSWFMPSLPFLTLPDRQTLCPRASYSDTTYRRPPIGVVIPVPFTSLRISDLDTTYLRSLIGLLCPPNNGTKHFTIPSFDTTYLLPPIGVTATSLHTTDTTDTTSVHPPIGVMMRHVDQLVVAPSNPATWRSSRPTIAHPCELRHDGTWSAHHILELSEDRTLSTREPCLLSNESQPDVTAEQVSVILLLPLYSILTCSCFAASSGCYDVFDSAKHGF